MSNRKDFPFHVNKLHSRRNTILPKTIKVQLVDENNTPIKFENILCHLKIFVDSMTYNNYSFIPTNSEGQIKLTREDIIQNTELKHYINDNLPLDKSPTSFEFFIMDFEMLSNLIAVMENSLRCTPNQYRQNLVELGFDENKIELELPKIIRKQQEDQMLLDFLKTNNNGKIQYSENLSTICDEWSSIKEYNYNLKVM